MFTCYECGKEITDANPGVTFDNLNFAHRDCVYKTDLSKCSPACNCIKCNPSKTLCNAPCDAVSETSTNVLLEASLPRVERFSDLPDGTEFYLAQTYAYGGRQLYRKVADNNGLHNAVLCTDSYYGVRVNDLRLVIRK